MPKTILIVDDEEMVVDMARRKLVQEGYLAIGAGNGEEALKVLGDGLVDLIILDVEMPKMNGYMFLTELKNIPGAENIPVIMLTAYDAMEPIFRRHNAADYLTKPVRFQELMTRIHRVLGLAGC